MAATTTPRRKISAPRTGARPYDAFVSYSHAADGRLAPSLQAGLQSLAKPWYRRGALRVFRDKTSLSASPELWPAIEGALSQARYFILLASPEAADSHWVDQEVRWWREHKSHDTVLIALTDGELRWDDARRDFDAGAPIPPGLRGWFPREPLWVDLRWARGGQDVSMRNPRFRDSVGELAAPLHGLPKDELIGEDISQHRRTLRLARGAVALLVLLLTLAIVGAVIALVQRNTARDQRELALAGQVAATSGASLADRLDVAQLLAAEGYNRRDTPQTRAALFQAATASPHLARFADAGAPVTALTPVPDGSGVLVGGSNGVVRAWSVARGRPGPPLVDLRRPVSAVQASGNGRYLAAGDEGGSISVVDLRGGATSRVALDGRIGAVAVSDDGRWLAAGSDDFRVTVHDLGTGEVAGSSEVDQVVFALAFRGGGLFVGGHDGSGQLRSVPRLFPLSDPTLAKTPAANYTAAYSADGRYFGMYRSGAQVWRTNSDRVKREFPVSSTGGATAMAIAPDAARVALATEGAISVVEPRLRGRGPYNLGAQPGGLVTAPMTGISGRTGFLTFVGSDERLVSSSGRLLALWDVRQASRIARPLGVVLPDKTTATVPPGLALAHGGRLVAWTSEKPEVGVWDPEQGRRSLPVSKEMFVNYYVAALGRDGRRLAVAGSEGIQIWNLVGSDDPVNVPSSGGFGNLVQVLEPERSGDSMLAVFESGRIDRLSLDSGRLRRVVGAPKSGIAFGTLVAVAPQAGLALRATGGRVVRIDMANGRTSEGRRVGLEFVAAMAVSRDGRLLAAADGQETAVLWDLERGRPLRRLGVGRVSKVALDPQKRLMATLTAEGRLGVWDLRSGTRLGEVRLPQGGQTFSPEDPGVETALRFSSNGDLWTATAGGELIRWPMSPDAWTRTICRTVNRSLTDGEWERHIGTTGSPEVSCRGD